MDNSVHGNKNFNTITNIREYLQENADAKNNEQINTIFQKLDENGDGILQEYEGSIIVFEDGSITALKDGQVIADIEKPVNEQEDFVPFGLESESTDAEQGSRLIQKLSQKMNEPAFANDIVFKEHFEKIVKNDADMAEIETKYGFKRGDRTAMRAILHSRNKDRLRDKSKYMKLSTWNRTKVHLIEKYIKTMENWQDGPSNPNAYKEKSGVMHTKLERVTLKNGQHVWKSNLGLFKPDIDGSISNEKVPQEWISE